jgi:hypothetical protein
MRRQRYCGPNGVYYWKKHHVWEMEAETMKIGVQASAKYQSLHWRIVALSRRRVNIISTRDDYQARHNGEIAFSISQMQVSKLLLNICCMSHSIDRAMRSTTDARIARRAPRQLHWQTTLADGKRMAVLTTVPMTRAVELVRHGGDDHAHLAR